VRKTYQNEEIDPSQPTVPEAVSVALAGEVQGGFVGPGDGHRVTSRADNDPNGTRVQIWDGQGGLMKPTRGLSVLTSGFPRPYLMGVGEAWSEPMSSSRPGETIVRAGCIGLLRLSRIRPCRAQ
jgi:hypothetical protein